MQTQFIFKMKHVKDYIIPFKGLKLGLHSFEYQIKEKFFEAYQYDDFIKSDITVKLDFLKKDTLFELLFLMSGTVRVNCDVSGEEYEQPVEGSLKLIVTFGEAFNNDHEDILIIPQHAYELDISQYIYELIVLNTPIKRVHPGILDGTLESETLDKLDELSRKTEKKTDPRWDKLKELIKDKK